jgi:hypothetical protein
MKKNLMLVSVLAVLGLGAGTAFAGGSEGSIGIGAEAQIVGGLGGVSGNYDMGQFHVGGFLGFADDGDDNTAIALGGRFYYHLHSTAMSDFGVGGSIGLGLLGDGSDATEDPTLVFIEPGFQIRAFVASNVALSFTGGLSLGLADADGIVVTGDLNAGAGVHYYFF